MSLIKLQIDKYGEVIASGWANPKQHKAGDVTPDGFTIYDVADDEIAALVKDHTKLTDGHLVVDSDYVTPADPVFTPQPSTQDKINAQLTRQLAEVTKTATTAQAAVVALTKQQAEQLQEAK